MSSLNDEYYYKNIEREIRSIQRAQFVTIWIVLLANALVVILVR